MVSVMIISFNVISNLDVFLVDDLVTATLGWPPSALDTSALYICLNSSTYTMIRKTFVYSRKNGYTRKHAAGRAEPLPLSAVCAELRLDYRRGERSCAGMRRQIATATSLLI
jgi:hypothetical protein